MKKLFCIMTISALFTISFHQTTAATEATPISTPASGAVDVAKVDVMVNRLNEIDAMDKTNMSASEKKGLRKEARTIKKVSQTSGGGVYLSVGTLLLIIILLIVLL